MELQERLDLANEMLAEKDHALAVMRDALRHYAASADQQPAADALAIATFAMPDYQVAAKVGTEMYSPPLGEAPRSGEWPRVRREHMAASPACAVCGSRDQCVPHHMKPFHLFPALELDPANLITLCPPHHLLFGHLMNWRAWNPDVHADAGHWSTMIAGRPLASKE